MLDDALAQTYDLTIDSVEGKDITRRVTHASYDGEHLLYAGQANFMESVVVIPDLKIDQDWTALDA